MIRERPFDILIPIYNAYQLVLRCLESVYNHTDPMHSVYLLDDCSTDYRLWPLLTEVVSRDPRFQLLPASKTSGFVRNINRGFYLSKRPIVLLNSDTEVTSGWLGKMSRCLYSDNKIGIVSPLSNSAMHLSVPRIGSNELPAGIAASKIAEFISRYSKRVYPRLPSAVGFCMAISRETIERVGHLDPIYSPGYQEESDYCMRARQMGIESVCCDDTYVYHRGLGSFGDQNWQAILRRNRFIMHAFWPNYFARLDEFLASDPLRAIRWQVAEAFYSKLGGPTN